MNPAIYDFVLGPMMAAHLNNSAGDSPPVRAVSEAGSVPSAPASRSVSGVCHAFNIEGQ